MPESFTPHRRPISGRKRRSCPKNCYICPLEEKLYLQKHQTDSRIALDFRFGTFFTIFGQNTLHIMNITEILPGIHYVGVNDRTTTRFEGLWSLPHGVSYNAYLVADEKVALIDTVEEAFGSRLFENIRETIGDRPIDYLVVNHMEPDHSSSIRALRLLYPDIRIVGNAKTLQMIQGFYGIDTGTLEVKEGDTISLGAKTLSFYMAPMVHWPETMVTWCAEAGTLFSGDAFGTFGAIDGGITDSQLDPSRYWDEMRQPGSRCRSWRGAPGRAHRPPSRSPCRHSARRSSSARRWTAAPGRASGWRPGIPREPARRVFSVVPSRRRWGGGYSESVSF